MLYAPDILGIASAHISLEGAFPKKEMLKTFSKSPNEKSIIGRAFQDIFKNKNLTVLTSRHVLKVLLGPWIIFRGK
jgi:hypothetical protein